MELNDSIMHQKHVYACRRFEAEFDLALGKEVQMTHENVTLGHDNEHRFFISIILPSPPPPTIVIDNNNNNGGERTLFSCKSTISVSQTGVHLSRIENPLKKFNSNKENCQLLDHARSLALFGGELTK